MSTDDTEEVHLPNTSMPTTSLQIRSDNLSDNFASTSQLKPTSSSDNFSSLTVIECLSQEQLMHHSPSHHQPLTAIQTVCASCSSSSPHLHCPKHSTQVMLQTPIVQTYSNENCSSVIPSSISLLHHNSAQPQFHPAKAQSEHFSSVVQPFSLMARTRPLLSSQIIDSQLPATSLDNRRKTFRARASLGVTVASAPSVDKEEYRTPAPDSSKFCKSFDFGPCPRGMINASDNNALVTVSSP
uniref:Uncharacterized protein n=1 Tax=Syphacia muris TaxID=451379 RepID=A0A0N5AIH7_9BILA